LSTNKSRFLKEFFEADKIRTGIESKNKTALKASSNKDRLSRDEEEVNALGLGNDEIPESQKAKIEAACRVYAPRYRVHRIITALEEAGYKDAFRVDGSFFGLMQNIRTTVRQIRKKIRLNKICRSDYVHDLTEDGDIESDPGPILSEPTR